MGSIGCTLFHMFPTLIILGNINRMVAQTDKFTTIIKVNKIEFVKELSPENFPSYKSEEERKELCFAAKTYAQFGYLDDIYTWGYYKFGLEKAIYCATIPSIYLRESYSREKMEIYVRNSEAQRYVLDKKTIQANSVMPIPVKGHSDTLRQNALTNFDIEDRRVLCTYFRGSISSLSLDLVGIDVPKAQLYEFEFADTTETHVAISCPTIPPSYFRLGDSETEVKLIVIQPSLNQYNFEVESEKPTSVSLLPGGEYLTKKSDENCLNQWSLDKLMELCKAAAEHASLGLTDAYTLRAYMYSFKYQQGADRNELALMCPTLPRSYLTYSSTNNFKITVSHTSADNYAYNAEVVKFVLPNKKLTSTKTDINWKDHLFSKLDDEYRWIYCWTAKNRIPNIVTIAPPGTIDFAKEYIFEFQNLKQKFDLAIECPTTPKIYLRLENSEVGIKVVLPLVKFNVPETDGPLTEDKSAKN